MGRSSKRTQERRYLKKHRSSGAAASLLCRLAPCCSERAGLSKSRLIQMAPASFRLSGPAHFILKPWTSLQSFVSGSGLLRSVLSKLILPLLSSKVSRITGALTGEAFLLLIPKGKCRECEDRGLLLQARIPGLLMRYQPVLRNPFGPQFFHASAKD